MTEITQPLPRSPEPVEGPVASPLPQEAAPIPATNLLATVTLAKPIPLGDGQSISALAICKPDGVHLLGTSLYSLLRMEPEAICKVLPRISTPSVGEVQAIQMSGRDLFMIGEALSDFLQYGAA